MTSRSVSFVRGWVFVGGAIVACGGATTPQARDDAGSGAGGESPTTGSSSGGAGSDGGSCVEVDLSNYDTSCGSNSDCVSVTVGTICATTCICGGAAINQHDYGRYLSLVARAEGQNVCNCPAEGAIRCVQGPSGGVCTACPLSGTPPSGCP